MIKIKVTGNFKKTERFLTNAQRISFLNILEKYGSAGVSALSQATPTDTGLTASSWRYTIKFSGGRYRIEWYNTNEKDGVQIAILLQYGHASPDGTFVEGIDFVNPAMKPTFDALAESLWREVSTL